jgi:uncharacterized metal-binding protein
MSECEKCNKCNAKIIIYACSGSSNVGSIADQVARKLASADCCPLGSLAAIAAGIDTEVDAARSADMNVVIDGCSSDCAKKIMDKASIRNCVHICLTDLGLTKQACAPATEAEVAKAITIVRTILEKLSTQCEVQQRTEEEAIR